MRVDELEKLANLFIISYIGSFALDFTAGLWRAIRDGAIDGVLRAAADGDLSAFSSNIFAMARPMPRGCAGDETDSI